MELDMDDNRAYTLNVFTLAHVKNIERDS